MTKDEVVQGTKLTRATFLEPALAGSLSNPPSRALPSASDLGVWLWNTFAAFPLETAPGFEKRETLGSFGVGEASTSAFLLGMAPGTARY